MTKKAAPIYGNDSISSLKGADRVRKRPAVIFGSDGLEGCQHSVFEILSNAIDEAREGYGNKIIVTKFYDGSIEILDNGRGIPVDFNKRENCFNWELVFCELYAGGKYDNNEGENYEFSLGLNGLGLCATQYAAEYMEVEIFRDNQKFSLRFEKGENVGGLKKEEYNSKTTGSRIRWRPDLDVFTETDIPVEFFRDILKRQAVVNAKLTFVLKVQTENGFETEEFLYENGIKDYVKELSGEETLSNVQYWEAESRGRDREDMPDYKVKCSVSFCFSNKSQAIQYYHNSSFLEYGGSPEKAVKSAFVSQIDSF
ncbi:MAG: ATP-binding protein, partial [Oscillospiraceae bacterium]